MPKKLLIYSGFLKPSDGLEPSTPSLAMRSDRQPVAIGGNGFGLFEPFSRAFDLRPLATGCAPLLHKCSIRWRP
jgi:hypothetical protein